METAVMNPVETELRTKILTAVKQHKASWIQLGQYLFAVYQDKHYKTWGYQTFEGYCRKELRIKQQTASKLLKSYNFIESEEPQITKMQHDENPMTDENPVPDFESVNLLRLAKQNELLTPQDIAEVRESVIEKAKEPKEVRAQMKRILEEKDPRSHEELMRSKKNAAMRRAVTVLRTLKNDFAKENMIPKFLIQQITELADKLDDQID